MTNFTDNLWRDLVREHGATLAQADQARPRRNVARPLLRRPRVLAGGSLGLVGVGAGLVLALGAGGAEAPAAFAITQAPGGTVTVQINDHTGLPQANMKLAAMGIGEAVTIDMAHGPATTSGPVACTPVGDPTGPKLSVLLASDGTYTIAAGNTGAGTWHLHDCVYGAPTANNSGPYDPNAG